MKVTASNRKLTGEAPTVVKGEVNASYQVIEGSTESYSYNEGHGYKKVIAGVNNNYSQDIDVSWLPAAAAAYDTSPKIEDYLLVDVAAVSVDIPNRNMQAFPFEEVSFFDGYQGSQVYQTFVGMPSCLEHDNKVEDDTDKAKGVIFGSTLQYIPMYDIYKIRILQGFDRTKDINLADEIQKGIRNFYSMGSYVNNFICPICGVPQQNKYSCSHGKVGKGNMYNNQMFFHLCIGTKFFEMSSVTTPADPFADGKPF